MSYMKYNNEFEKADTNLYRTVLEGYFDYASTTPVFAEVIDDIDNTLAEFYGNPSSLTDLGNEANSVIKEATDTIKNCLGASNYELFYTSGATESNNWVAQILDEGDMVFTTVYEHPSVLNAFKARKANIVYIDCLEKFNKQEFIRNLEFWKPKLVSIMGVNNETGIMPVLYEISNICKGKTLIHCDITQVIPHCKLNCNDFNFDFCSFSGHKFGAPKGIGGLLVKKSALKILPTFIYGGHQQNNRRAGTENIAYIKGMATALKICNANLSKLSFPV